MKFLEEKVFPSDTKSILFEEKDEEYGGAHHYRFKKCIGFNNGETQYVTEFETLSFVRKTQGGVTPGVQSEQVVIALIDRHRKLDAKFPSPQNKKMIKGLEMFLDACKERVEERMEAGVMGKLENIPEKEIPKLDVEKPVVIESKKKPKKEVKEKAEEKAVNKVESKTKEDMPKGKGYPRGKKSSSGSSSESRKGSKTTAKASKPSRGKKSK